MTKTTYTATDAAGGLHTRKTDRVYSHTVVVQKSKENAIKRANEQVAHDIKHGREQIARGANTVEQNKAYLISQKHFILVRDDKYATEMQTEGRAFTAQWGTPEAYAAARHVEAIAKIEATDWNLWFNAGWCGRLDLAQKLYAKCMADPFYGAVDMIEAKTKQEA